MAEEPNPQEPNPQEPNPRISQSSALRLPSREDVFHRQDSGPPLPSQEHASVSGTSSLSQFLDHVRSMNQPPNRAPFMPMHREQNMPSHQITDRPWQPLANASSSHQFAIRSQEPMFRPCSLAPRMYSPRLEETSSPSSGLCNHRMPPPPNRNLSVPHHRTPPPSLLVDVPTLKGIHYQETILRTPTFSLVPLPTVPHFFPKSYQKTLPLSSQSSNFSNQEMASLHERNQSVGMKRPYSELNTAQETSNPSRVIPPVSRPRGSNPIPSVGGSSSCLERGLKKIREENEDSYEDVLKLAPPGDEDRMPDPDDIIRLNEDERG